MKPAAVAIVLFCSAVSLAADIEDKRKAYLEAGKAEARSEVVYYNSRIEELRREIAAARKRGGVATDIIPDRTRQIGTFTKAKTDLDKAGFKHPWINVRKPAKGQIGLLALHSHHLQWDFVPKATVLQVIDGQNLIIEVTPYGQRNTFNFWLHASTENIVDDQPYNLRGPYEVLGTRTYPTASGGSSTVFELTEFDPGPLP